MLLYDENQQKDLCVEQMQKAIELNPDNAAALNYLGYTFADQGVRLDEAESLVRRALSINPRDGYYIDSLGWVYYQKGDYKKAIEELERAVALATDDPTIAEHLGDAYIKVGRVREALRIYEDAASHSDDTEQTERIRSKIEELEKAPVSRKDL